MKVFKFGGASVKDQLAVKNVAEVLKLYPNEKLLVVISAMGKTTNLLEEIVKAYQIKNENQFKSLINKAREFHKNMLDLIRDKNNPVFNEVEFIFKQLENKFNSEFPENYDYEYDQIVSIGEKLSTLIVSAFLKQELFNVKWLDAGNIIRTNHKHRDAEIDWETTTNKSTSIVKPMLNEVDIVITQGFIGKTKEGFYTTLGREGSDYSAAIFAYCLNANDVSIWKDVPGMLNADPKWFSNTKMLEKISYKEAIELAYYGATVIHPKTLKPLQNKNIPLFVKSFLAPEKKGSVIQEDSQYDHLIPSYIFKVNQLLVSITPRDFSFIIEENLSDIFNRLAILGVKINMMQNSALSFSFAIDQEKVAIPNLLTAFQNDYEIKYNDGLELVTIRHYTDAIIDEITEGKTFIMQQKTRQTIRILMKDNSIV